GCSNDYVIRSRTKPQRHGGHRDQNPATYGKCFATFFTSSNLSTSIAVGSHLPCTNASRTATGICAVNVIGPAVIAPVFTSATISVSGDFSSSVCSLSIVSWSAVKQGTPRTEQLPRKISENDSPTIARMPKRTSPCGACPQDDPQPKFELTTRIDAPW